MRGGVHEIVILDAAHGEHGFVGHREETIEPLTDRDVRTARFNDVAKAPDSDLAPAVFGRKEAPIANGVTRDRIAYIVRGDRELVDGDTDLSVLERGLWPGDRFRLPVVAAIDPELADISHRVGPSLKSFIWRKNELSGGECKGRVICCREGNPSQGRVIVLSRAGKHDLRRRHGHQDTDHRTARH